MTPALYTHIWISDTQQFNLIVIVSFEITGGIKNSISVRQLTFINGAEHGHSLARMS